MGIFDKEYDKILDNILKLKHEKKLSDAVLERQLELSSKTVYSWKRKSSKSFEDKIPEIAELLGVPVSQIYSKTILYEACEIKNHPAEKEISKNLRHYRQSRQISEKELADKLGVCEGTVCRWEDGISPIDVGNLCELCKILEVSVNDIYGEYSNATQEEYSQTERQLIKNFRSMNEEGQDQAAHIVAAMSGYTQYIKTDKFGLLASEK